jgi:hypothetical protein
MGEDPGARRRSLIDDVRAAVVGRFKTRSATAADPVARASLRRNPVYGEGLLAETEQEARWGGKLICTPSDLRAGKAITRPL